MGLILNAAALHSSLPFICITSISAADFKSQLTRRFYEHFSFIDPGVLYKDRAINKMDGKVRN